MEGRLNTRRKLWAFNVAYRYLIGCVIFALCFALKLDGFTSGFWSFMAMCLAPDAFVVR